MNIILTAVRKSDNKVLYFYDEDSREDYIDMYDEELTDYGFAIDIPFGEKIIDISPERTELRNMCKLAGITMQKDALKDIYGRNDSKDEEKEFAKIKNISKHVLQVNDKNNTVEEVEDDNPTEVSIRKNKLDTVRIFEAFYDGLDKDRKIAVKNTFANNNLDIDKLDEYIDKEINMNIDFYLTDYDTEKALKKAKHKYEQTDEYKWHKNFMKAIEDSYDAVCEIDMHEDAQKLNQ